MTGNPTKSVLANGGIALGTMIQDVRGSESVALLKMAGFDYVLIDNEHTPLDLSAVSDMCRTARLCGITPIVRVPDTQYHLIARRLDAGAMGIMVPRIRTREQVELAVECIKYPPIGKRGVSQPAMLTGYEPIGLPDYIKATNEETMVVVQVETKEAMDDLENILSVPDVDGVLMGLNDLSVNLGVTDQNRGVVVEDAIDRVIEVCDEYGVAPGLHIRDMDHILDCKRRGMRMLALNTDTGFMMDAASQAAKQMRAG